MPVRSIRLASFARVSRAAIDDDGLPPQVDQPLRPGVAAHQQAAESEKVRHREGHLLAALGGVGGAAALQVGSSRQQARDAVGRTHQQVLGAQVGHPQLASQSFDYEPAQIQ